MTSGTWSCHVTMAVSPHKDDGNPSQFQPPPLFFVTEPGLDSCQLVPVRDQNSWLCELHLSYDPATLQGQAYDCSVSAPWDSDSLPVKWDCSPHSFLLHRSKGGSLRWDLVPLRAVLFAFSLQLDSE